MQSLPKFPSLPHLRYPKDWHLPSWSFPHLSKLELLCSPVPDLDSTVLNRLTAGSNYNETCLSSFLWISSSNSPSWHSTITQSRPGTTESIQTLESPSCLYSSIVTSASAQKRHTLGRKWLYKHFGDLLHRLICLLEWQVILFQLLSIYKCNIICTKNLHKVLPSDFISLCMRKALGHRLLPIFCTPRKKIQRKFHFLVFEARTRVETSLYVRYPYQSNNRVLVTC